MVSFSDFKKQLGELADNYSNEHLKSLMEREDKLADLFFDLWIDRKKNVKNLSPIQEQKKI
jgi:hypothetical protein